MKKNILLLSCLIGLAAFAQSPIITNVTASGATASSAIINYTVNALGQNTTRQVYYGHPSSQGNATTTPVNVTNNTPTAYSTMLTGLAQNRRYTARVFVPSTVSGANGGTGQVIFTTLGNLPVPTITINPVSNITTTTATINISMNPNGSASTGNLEYIDSGSSSGIMTAIGINETGTTDMPFSKILTGLTPNTIYNYVIYGSNTSGEGPELVGTFTTLQAAPANQLLYHFPFNGNLVDQPNNVQFTVTSGPPAAYSSNNTVLIGGGIRTFTTNLPNLPQGNAARSVSIRIFFNANQLSFASKFFAWGTPTANQAYGADFDPSRSGSNKWSNYFWGATDHPFSPNSINFGTWQHFVLTHDGTTVRIYQNGSLITSAVKTLNTTGTTITLGDVPGGTVAALNCDVDDLKIYNYALSQSEITALNNSLSSENFNANNLKFNLYPNPAIDILNIAMETKLNSVEIYSLLGQKVLSSDKNQVDVSILSKGMYMVRVEDVEGSVSTQKLVVE